MRNANANGARMHAAVGIRIRDILLQTEDGAELDELFHMVEQELRPSGVLEKIYAADIVKLTWEINRLTRVKAEMIKATVPQAVESLAKKLSPTPTLPHTCLAEVPEAPRQEVALDWNFDAESRKKVAAFLKRFGLNESAIEAEAVALCIPVFEKLEPMLDSLERRRSRALFNLCSWREYSQATPQAAKKNTPNGSHFRGLERLPRPSRLI